MNSIVVNFEKIKALVNNSKINIVAVSKSFQHDHIKPLIDYGHRHFGENKVQEATNKWANVKDKEPGINLHMIGRLQSNKAKEAVNLFDYIHTVDTPKLARLISKFEVLLNKKRKYFIQVNIGNENQKNGIRVEELDNFFIHCSRDLNLDIIGLMAIPPNDGNANLYFRHLMQLNDSLGLKELSLGMSGDFKVAIKYKATFVRIGSAIFGNRN
jgi:pyridoxal phosphate enzyme (YggS family)